MDVLIRTDASEIIGSGHVMRCLTIAEQLRTRNCSVSFYMKELPGNLIEYVKKRGFQVVSQFYPVDLCIIDHYEIDIKWELSIRPFVKKIIVIDDLADRPHDCDVLLDQNIVSNYRIRYDHLVPKECKKLLGAEFLIMRDEFLQKRLKVEVRTGHAERILIFMGGTDPTGETLNVLQAIIKCNASFVGVDIVVGNGNPQKEKIESICNHYGFNYHCQIDYMSTLMQQADFSFGAGGSTTWERCFLGLPSSSTIVAQNQVDVTEEAAKLGVVWNLGWHEQVSVQTYVDVLESLVSKQKELQTMSSNGLELTQNAKNPNAWIDLFLEGLT